MPLSAALTRALAGGLATATLAGALGLTVLAPASAAGTPLLEEGFAGSTVGVTNFVAGGTGTTACLTAGTSTTQTPVPGCGLPVPDAPGSGALRLTPTQNSTSGFLVYDEALPTKAGLDISFDQYTWGGGGADGLSFFLADGAQQLTRAGGVGGSLGYNNLQSSLPGVPDALLGIGFDTYGNHTVETHNPDCNGVDDAYRGVTADWHKSTVSVRGPGDGFSGYCLLAPATPAPGLDNTSSPVRPAPVATRVVVDPPSQTAPKVTVYVNGVQVVQVDQPAALATTPTFTFGWGASTGGLNNNHEISSLRVASVLPVQPDLAVTAATAPVTAGTAQQLSWTVDVDPAAGPLPAGEVVGLTLAAPAGLGLGLPSGSGWGCSGTSAQMSCTYVVPGAITPGSTLPTVTARAFLPSSGSGAFPFTATVDSASNDDALAADDSVTTTAVWRPVAYPLTYTGLQATPWGQGVGTRPGGLGTNLQFEMLTSADPAVGTVTFQSPYVMFSPAPGRSGLLSATFRAFDGYSYSDAVTASAVVRPMAAYASMTAPQGSTTTQQLPAAVGTSPSYSLVSEDVPGPVTLSPAGLLEVTPGTDASGQFVVTYVVVDTYGYSSYPVTVRVSVPPVAGTTSWTSSLDADGAAEAVLTLPAPSGTGPFTYALEGGLPAGTTGGLAGDQLTVAAVDGVSGAHRISYRVTDAAGLTSDPQTVDVTFRPYYSVPDATGTAADPVTTAAPVVVGDGPFTTVVESTSRGTATTAPDGRITLDTGGESGLFTVLVHVEDENGVASSTEAVQVEVAPVASAVGADAVASATPAATRLTPAPATGTGPFTLALVSGPAPEQGTAVVAGSGVDITPAAGVSGVLEVLYTVTDAQGYTSAPAAATLRVLPAAAGSALSLPSGSSATSALPAPVGSGPFTHQLVSAASGTFGAVAVADGGLRFDAAPTFSGQVVVQYTVTDVHTLVSEVVEVVVEVVPATPGAVVPGTTGSPVTGPAPTPSGSGPFTYELVGTVPAAEGTATIDPATGVVTFVPAPGWSGDATVGYRAFDGAGTPTAPSSVVFEVAPVATTTPVPPTRRTTGTPVEVDLPEPVGTGPFTYELVGTVPASDGTATIDPATGDLTFVPAPGSSGPVTLQYRVVDATGNPSAPATVPLVIAPLAPAPAPAGGPSGSPVSVQLPAPVGEGPFTWTVVQGPSAERGVLTLDRASGEVTFVPAAGYAGGFDVRYTVTDVNGVVSDVQVLAVAVAAPPLVERAAAVVAAARLPRTGGELALTAGVAALLLAAGGALVLTTRRRTAAG